MIVIGVHIGKKGKKLSRIYTKKKLKIIKFYHSFIPDY